MPQTPNNKPLRLATPKAAARHLTQSRYAHTSIAVPVPAWERNATYIDRPVDDLVAVYDESDVDPAASEGRLFGGAQEQDDDAFVFSPASFTPHTPSPLASAVHDHEQSYRRRSHDLSRTPPCLHSSPLSDSLHRSSHPHAAATPLEQYELEDEKDMEEFKNSRSHRRLSAEFNERKTRRSYELATEGWAGYDEKPEAERDEASQTQSPVSTRYSQYHFNPYTFNSHALPPRRYAYASPHLTHAHDETDIFSDYNACERISSPISSHTHEAEDNDDELEEQFETYTPTCTDALKMKWQAVALAWRFGVFRTKRRIRRGVGLST